MAARLVSHANCSLVFTSTRSAAERLGLALKILMPEEDEHIAVHHGSIDRDERFDIESRARGRSLESGGVFHEPGTRRGFRGR